jgi:methanogenic corrinoid protein MtbC1
MSTTPLVDELVVPLLERIGALWDERVLRPAHEHLASSVIRRVLSWVTEAFEAADTAPAVVAATLAGQVHELGAMLVATTAAAEGWRVLYLGADLPAEDIAAAARRTGVRAVALSLIYPDDGAHLSGECRRLARSLPEHVELVVGGAAAIANASALSAAGARVLADLASFRSLLRTAAAAEGQST